MTFFFLIPIIALFTSAASNVNGQVMNVRALYKACKPDALIPECGKNAICARVPRCKMGVCVCRLDGNYISARHNNYECEEAPTRQRQHFSSSLCNAMPNDFKKLFKRSLCGEDFQQQSSYQVESYYQISLSGKLLDMNEDCSSYNAGSSKCNSYKGLTCDNSRNGNGRCNCEWPRLERHDGTCYTAGYDEPCVHDHECDWMYRGTVAGERGGDSGNAVCDEWTQRCRCNKGYFAVPRVGVNYYLPVHKQINEIDVSVYNVSVLLSTTGRLNEPLSTSEVCLRESSKSRVTKGGSCSYLLTMVTDPLVCEHGLVCQYCPQEKEDNERQVLGTCVNPDYDDESELAEAKSIRAHAEQMDRIARIVLSVGLVVVTILISVGVFLLWRRHHNRMESITSSIKTVGWRKKTHRDEERSQHHDVTVMKKIFAGSEDEQHNNSNNNNNSSNETTGLLNNTNSRQQQPLLMFQPPAPHECRAYSIY